MCVHACVHVCARVCVSMSVSAVLHDIMCTPVLQVCECSEARPVWCAQTSLFLPHALLLDWEANEIISKYALPDSTNSLFVFKWDHALSNVYW